MGGRGGGASGGGQAREESRGPFCVLPAMKQANDGGGGQPCAAYHARDVKGGIAGDSRGGGGVASRARLSTCKQHGGQAVACVVGLVCRGPRRLACVSVSHCDGWIPAGLCSVDSLCCLGVGGCGRFSLNRVWRSVAQLNSSAAQGKKSHPTTRRKRVQAPPDRPLPPKSPSLQGSFLPTVSLASWQVRPGRVGTPSRRSSKKEGSSAKVAPALQMYPVPAWR